jgi:hypothetical protein
MVTDGSFNVTTTLAGGATVTTSRQASAKLRPRHAAAAQRCCRLRADRGKPMMQVPPASESQSIRLLAVRRKDAPTWE